ncbi:hypothetical protein [Zobellia nedashkovskayae]|uniref:hypothetical protein n=1 Tax=Zobellia nedashkovskayae TaxID=2779510 RepID=UPI00188AE876|nr:hypothetical protein [Zobellia nedashkovskayae]
MKEFETLGYYAPGFLHLKVNTDYDIRDLNELSTNPKKKSVFSTFLHEYIHFLQDLTTTNGLQNGNFFINLLKEINWEIRNDGKSEFNVPVEIGNKNNIEANFKLREIYKGETKGSELVKYDRYVIEYGKIQNNSGKLIEPIKYKVYYFDLKTKEEKKLYFGDVCLKEYIAHSIQKQFLESIEHHDIPYQIAEQILFKEYPDFGTNPKYLIALCDSSLMSYHPSQMFFNTINRMKKNKFVPTNCEDVYEFAYKDLKFTGEIGQMNVEQLFKHSIDSTNQQYSDTLKSPIFTPINEWLNHLFEQAKTLRVQSPSFICSLINDNGGLSDSFYEIFEKLGTPFFTNKKELGGFVPPRGLKNIHQQPYQLLVFKEILSTFFGTTSCSMYDFCLNSPERKMTNENCKKAPWKKVKERDLCPYAQMWKTWGLIDEIPVRK